MDYFWPMLYGLTGTNENETSGETVLTNYTKAASFGSSTANYVSVSSSTAFHISVSSDVPDKCVKEEWSEPDFPRYACEGSKVVSWIAVVYLLSMIIFGVAKCLASNGVRKIIDLRLDGVSFPQRPEFFVLLCSSLPLVFAVLARPLFTPLSLSYEIFIRQWGLAQTRFFFDLFTRTASIYHLIYWAYRTPIIRGLWRIKLCIDFYWSKWKNRPKPVRKVQKSQPRKSSAGLTKESQHVRRSGRTSEHGYGNKRRRSKSVRTGRSTGKSPASSSIQANSDQQQKQNQQPAPVINTGGVSLIAPQPLFIGQSNVLGPMMINPVNAPVVAYNQNMLNYPNMNIYNPVVGMQAAQFGYGMGFDISLPMGAVQSGFAPSNFPQQGALYAFNENTNETSVSQVAVSERTTKLEPPAEPMRSAIQSTPPTRLFSSRCKRIIPACIYVVSFVITIPSILAFEEEPSEFRFLAARCKPMCRSYFYYDLVVLVTIPTILITIVFYHAALAKKQLNGGMKMAYRLRCYYVTFILLNIPMFVLMLTSIGFRLSAKPYRDIYGTGILIAMTAYHSNFVLKPTVYTTACNCICCSDSCLQRFSLLNRFLVYFTTPVALKDKKAQMEGTVIAVSLQPTSNRSEKS